MKWFLLFQPTHCNRLHRLIRRSGNARHFCVSHHIVPLTNRRNGILMSPQQLSNKVLCNAFQDGRRFLIDVKDRSVKKIWFSGSVLRNLHVKTLQKKFLITEKTFKNFFTNSISYWGHYAAELVREVGEIGPWTI